MRVVLVVTKVEVICHRVANNQDKSYGVDDGFGSRVLPEMLGLVSGKETSGLDFGSRASREFFIEADNTLHADSIGCGADSTRRGNLGRDEGRETPTSDETHGGRWFRLAQEVYKGKTGIAAVN